MLNAFARSWEGEPPGEPRRHPARTEPRPPEITQGCLVEAERRKEGFTEGNKVTLADGQEWTFPKPRLRFFPYRGDDGKMGLGGSGTFDQEYRELFTAFTECDKDEPYQYWTLKIQIACHLLLANYELSDTELADLMPVMFDDEPNMEMWGNLSPVCLSTPPKHSTDGSNTP
jgi:hypothetical protein